MQKLNLNSTVKVKLTETGLKELESQWESLKSEYPKVGEYKEPTVDENGYCSMQLWSLMSSLGHLCNVGYEPPFELDMLVETTKEKG